MRNVQILMAVIVLLDNMMYIFLYYRYIVSETRKNKTADELLM